MDDRTDMDMEMEYNEWIGFVERYNRLDAFNKKYAKTDIGNPLMNEIYKNKENRHVY